MAAVKMAVVTVAKKKCVAVFANYQLKNLCRAIPGGRWNPKRRCWVYPLTPFTCKGLVDGFSGHNLTVPQEVRDCAAIAEEFLTKKHEAQAINSDLWPHQQKALRFMQSGKIRSFLLAHDMGAGKTRTVIEFLKCRNAKKVLVIAPMSVLLAWKRQVEKYWPEMASLVRIANKKNTKNKKIGMVREVQNFGGIFVINYESVWRDKIGETVLATQWDAIVVDECQKIRSHKNKVTKFCAKLHDLHQCAYRIAMSGTPIGKDCLQAFGIFRFLDAGIYGVSYGSFSKKYAVMGEFGPEYYINQDEFKERFHWITHRVSKAEALPFLPDQFHVEVPLELDKKSMKHYKELASELCTEIESKKVTVQNALVKMLRLQQITSGFIHNTDLDDTIELNSIKKDALEDILDGIDSNEPVIVFALFRHDLEAISEAAQSTGRAYMELSGQKDEWYRWQYNCNGGEVLGVQIKSGGAGVDLTRAKYCVYYSLGFSYDDYDQSLSRIHRPGQENKVTYYHLVCQKTLDKYIYKCIDRKKQIVNDIMEIKEILQ